MESTGVEIFAKGWSHEFYPDEETIAVAVDWWIYQIRLWCLLTQKDLQLYQDHIQAFDRGLTHFLKTWGYDFLYTEYGPMQQFSEMLREIDFPENLLPPDRKMKFKPDGTILVSIGRGSPWERIG